MKKAVVLLTLFFIGSNCIYAQEKAYSITFDPGRYTVESAEVDGNVIIYRVYKNIVYVTKPVDTSYQCLNLYVPAAYYENRSIDGYNAANAPIFFPNDAGGYMPALPGTVSTGGTSGEKANAALAALSKGYVVAYPGARGRSLKDATGKYYGKAPAQIVDLKAAVRYLKYNDRVMPGDANKIISNGTSAGGAMSALLGGTGNSKDYEPFLKAIGAADTTDDIFAVSAYCPITDLDHADAAYEWLYNDTKNDVKLTDEQLRISQQLKASFPAYVNALKLRNTDGTALVLDRNGNGSFRNYVGRYIISAAQKALDAGEDLSTFDWLTVNGNKVTAMDFPKYVRYIKRMKLPPAFDTPDLSSVENDLFGTEDVAAQHFTRFGLQNSKVKSTIADARTIKMMNALYYIETTGTTTAKHWRIRHGTVDRHGSLAVPAIFAAKLQNLGYNVSLAFPWQVSHSGDYDLDELFEWIKTICKKDRDFSQNQLRLCSGNPHYLLYQHKPVILITAAEHYGALINTGFDYVAYLNALQKRGMNYTRIFSGAYVEGEKDIQWMGYNNTLAPRPGKLISPWKRSNVPGYANGGNKFDLDQWDEYYFRRIKDILKQAAARNIIVEFTLFGNQYSDSIYAWSPLYPDNNIQQVGIKRENGFLDFQSLKDPALVARQEAMVVKIIKELNDFDNLYYEISNEPYNEMKDPLPVDQWHVRIAKLIRETEKELPKQHLIASNQAIFNNPSVDIANYHYVHIPDLPRFDSLLLLNKVISMDETMGTLKDLDVNDARVEAWDFILHGGGVYNNLSWEYTPEKPAGTAGADTVHRYFSYLQKFISSFDYTKMSYSPELLIKTPGKAITRLLAEPGSQYALYIHHSTPDIAEPPRGTDVWKYEADTAMFSDTVTLHFKTGGYEARWYDPSTGDWIGKPVRWKQKDGTHTFYTPSFITDIALKIISVTESTLHRSGCL